MGWEEDLEKMNNLDDLGEEPPVEKRKLFLEDKLFLLQQFPEGFYMDSKGRIGKVVFTTPHGHVLFNRYPSLNNKKNHLYAVIEMGEV